MSPPLPHAPGVPLPAAMELQFLPEFKNKFNLDAQVAAKVLAHVKWSKTKVEAMTQSGVDMTIEEIKSGRDLEV